MNLQPAAVIVDKTQLPEPIHEEADPRAGSCSHHFWPGSRNLPWQLEALGTPSLPKWARSRRIRASLFSLELKSWSTKSSSYRCSAPTSTPRTCRQRDPGEAIHHRLVNAQNDAICQCNCRPHAERLATRQPSPKKSPPPNIPRVASLPLLDTTLSLTFALPQIEHCVRCIPLSKECLFL